MATYVNDLRLKEIATGDESGTWGTSTNTNLELIANAMGVGAEAVANASTHTITMADGAADEFRSTFLRLTGGGQACTVTLAPNTLSHTWIMRNETAAALTLTQGSGANVVIAAGQTKIVATDGAGSGAVVYEMDDLELAGNLAVGGTLGVTGIATFTDDIIIGDGKTIGSASDVDAMTIASNGQVTFTQTLIGTALDISGDIDVDGTANLDVVDIDGAVNMATTALVTGVLTTTAATVFNGGFASNAASTITVADNSNNLTLTSTDGDANAGPNLDLYRNSTGPADGDLVGRINFRGRNDNSQDVDYAAWVSRISDASDGSEDGILRADIIAAGAVVDVLTLYGTEVVVNESSADVDFRVESDNSTHALFVRGSDGKVGIGESSPAATLHLDSAGVTAIAFDSDAGTQQYEMGTGYSGVGSANNFYLYNNTTSSTAFIVDADSKFLIGTTGHSFGERLTVNNNGNAYTAHLFAGSGATAPLIVRNANGASGTRSQIIFYYDASAVGSVTSTSSGTAFVTSSDQRLKDNIVDADDAGSKVDAIQVRKFDWKVDGSHQDYGMVAQELQTVAPEAVSAPEDPNEMMGVDYSKLVPMMLKEIQSLRARVNALEAE